MQAAYFPFPAVPVVPKPLRMLACELSLFRKETEAEPGLHGRCELSASSQHHPPVCTACTISPLPSQPDVNVSRAFAATLFRSVDVSATPSAIWSMLRAKR
jgi:hypothetical protein